MKEVTKMKKITALFLVLIITFSFVGCSTTASEGTAATTGESGIQHFPVDGY